MTGSHNHEYSLAFLNVPPPGRPSWRTLHCSNPIGVFETLPSQFTTVTWIMAPAS